MAQKTEVKVQDPRAERVLLDALRGKVRGRTELVKLTRSDAVALTGLPSEQAEPALKSLVKTYRSHLAVTDDGDLVYEFDPSLERRDKVTLRERLQTVGQAAWKAFTLFFKLWIVVTLVVYVVAFVAMMLALMFSRNSDDRDDRRGGGGGFPMIWFWLMPDMAPRGYYGDAGYGRAAPRKKPDKRFYQSVFDYVFGPKGAPADARAVDKQLIAFLREHKGRITASELTALTGLSLDAAEEELTRLMVEYDGEAEVAEDGSLIYVFADLMVSAEAAGTRWSWAWDAPDPVPPLTGNTGGTDAVISAFAGFNLLASFTIGPAFLNRFHLAGDPTAGFFVTLFPLIFSAIFFAVPAVRWIQRSRRMSRREKRQLRRALLREIYAAPDGQHDPAVLAALAAKRTGQPVEAARTALEKLLPELDGDVETDASGAMRYAFPRLREERAAVADARKKSADKGLGRVVFSSESEGPNG
jgi:hypothetical protein